MNLSFNTAFKLIPNFCKSHSLSLSLSLSLFCICISRINRELDNRKANYFCETEERPVFSLAVTNIAKAFFRRGGFCQLSSSAMFIYCYLRRLRLLQRGHCTTLTKRCNTTLHDDMLSR